MRKSDQNGLRISRFLEGMHIPAGAFSQLTRSSMVSFNLNVPNDDIVHYNSFGACFRPTLTSPFKYSHGIIAQAEGPNDGIVSVSSSVWGEYRGTLANVSHLDLINWTNRVKTWTQERVLGMKRKFKAEAFYLDIAGALVFTHVYSVAISLMIETQTCLPKMVSEERN